MAETGNLRFEAGVDVSKFEADIKRMEADIQSLQDKIKDMPDNPLKPPKPIPDAVMGSYSQLSAKAADLKAKMDAIKPYSPEWAKLSSELNRTQSEMDKVADASQKTKGVLSGVGGLMAGAFASVGIASLGSQIIEVTSSFQKYEAVLTNTLGSQKEAQDVMAGIQQFAAATPFSLDELTNSYVKLTNYGMQPSMEQMRQFGDVAASVGKGFDQFAEAVADAATGSNERLKEFGITANMEGDKIMYTFKGQTTEVDRNAEAIKNYLSSLGDVKGVKGSMEAISKTMEGQISNLQDKISGMFNDIGQGSSGAISGAISLAGTLVDHYEEIAKVIGVMVIAYGSYKAVLMVTQAMQRANVAAEQIKNFLGLTKAIQGATMAQQGLNAAQKANVIGLAIAGITALISVVMMFREKVKSASEMQEEFNNLQQQTKDLDATTGMIDRYDELSKKQTLTNEEQAEYNGLIESLSKKYPDAIAKIDEHGKVLGLNSDKLKKYNDQQKEALKLVATEQLSDTEKAIEKAEKKLKIAQAGTSETKQKYVGGGMYGGSTIEVERSGKERAEAAEDVLKLSEELEKLKELQSGLKETLGKKSKIQVGVDVVAGNEAPKVVKATVKEQIKTINDEIKAQEKSLKSMRLPGATATPEEIEATEKGIKALQTKLANLTGEKVKSSADKSKEAVKGSIAYLEDELKRLKDKTGTFTDPTAEAENSKKIVETTKKIEDAWLNVRKEREKSLGITTTDPTGGKKMTSKTTVSPFEVKDTKTALAPMKQLTAEEKNRLEVQKQQVDAQNNLSDQQEIQNDNLEGLAKGLGEAADFLSGMASVVGEFNEELGQSLQTLADMAGQASNFMSAIAKGDYVAAAISGMQMAATAVNEISKNNRDEQYKDLTEAIEKQNGLLQRQLGLGELLKDQDWIDFTKRKIEQLTKSLDKYNKTLAEIDVYTKGSKPGSLVKVDTSMWDYADWIAALGGNIYTFDREAATAILEQVQYDKETIEQLTDDLEAAANEIREAVLGFGGDDLTSSVVDGLTQGFKLAEDGLGDFADSFRDLMQNAAIQALTATFETQYLTKLMDQFYTAMESVDGDGVKLTEEERAALQDSYRIAVEEMQLYYDQWSSLFEDAAEDSEKATGISGEAKSITESTAVAIEGNMNAILFNIIDTKKIIDQQLITLQEIRNNTSYNYRLVGIDENIEKLNKNQVATNDYLSKLAAGGGGVNYGL